MKFDLVRPCSAVRPMLARRHLTGRTGTLTKSARE